MSLFKKIYSNKALSVLDFGSDRARVLIAEKKPDGSFEILGAGDSEARGMESGEIANLGDAAESVMEALKKAENASGVKVQTLYFNFDDAEIQSIHSHGSRSLAGEGEIQEVDVDEAKSIAERLVGNFEKTIVYSTESAFLIDDRDRVENPVGVFGRKLDVTMHILQARSQLCENWQKLIERSQVERGALVLSAWSTAMGILSPEKAAKKSIIIDAGKDFINFSVFAKNRILEYRALLNGEPKNGGWSEKANLICGQWITKNPDIEEILVTGDLAEDPGGIDVLQSSLGLAVKLAPPLGISKLSAPRFSSLAGLLIAADELQKKTPILHRERGLLGSAKEKAVSFLNEYF